MLRKIVLVLVAQLVFVGFAAAFEVLVGWSLLTAQEALRNTENTRTDLRVFVATQEGMLEGINHRLTTMDIRQAETQVMVYELWKSGSRKTGPP